VRSANIVYLEGGLKYACVASAQPLGSHRGCGNAGLWEYLLAGAIERAAPPVNGRSNTGNRGGKNDYACVCCCMQLVFLQFSWIICFSTQTSNMCNHTAAHSVLEAWVEDKEELGLLVPGIRSDRVSKVMGASC
jgi:hypothetical protein